MTSRETPPEAPADPVALTRGHLHQVDLVRLLTFGSVILVHTIATTAANQDPVARGVLMLLHFTRETFFVITGFVLFYSSYRPDLDLRRFWRRRFLLIGVPYLVWSLVYWAHYTYLGYYPHGALRALGLQLVTGTAEYHLYFLLVSMQIYLVFGLLVRLVRATAGHHVALLAAAVAFQLALFWLLHDVLPSWHTAPGWVTTAAGYAQEALPAYLAYVIAGALAAVHVSRVQGWVLAHGRTIAVTVAVGAVLTEAAYVWQVRTGTPPFRASDVLQPVLLPWTFVFTTALLALGLRYALRRRPGLFTSAVQEGSRISFGVFLVHPVFITLLFETRVGTMAQPWESLLLWLGAVLTSFGFAEVASRTPLSLPLTGRRFARPAPRRGPDNGPHKRPDDGPGNPAEASGQERATTAGRSA